MPGNPQHAPRAPSKENLHWRQVGASRRQGEDGPGLVGRDAPGQRSGHGVGSVMDQMQKDQQRNANQSEGEADVPTPSRDSTA
jgi:hypothetical protein